MHHWPLNTRGYTSAVAGDTELLTAVLSLRDVVDRLSGVHHASCTVVYRPQFTTHGCTLGNMRSSIDTARACCVVVWRGLHFICSGVPLASSFYLHDIGMAYAATEEGVDGEFANRQSYQSLSASIASPASRTPSIEARVLACTVGFTRKPRTNLRPPSSLAQRSFYSRNTASATPGAKRAVEWQKATNGTWRRSTKRSECKVSCRCLGTVKAILIRRITSPSHRLRSYQPRPGQRLTAHFAAVLTSKV